MSKTMPPQRPGRSRQDHETPPEFLLAVKRLLAIKQFDCDLAATLANAVCSKFYTEFQNSLVQPWKLGPGWNWLNPPFANIRPWAEKAEHEVRLGGAQTAMLVPAAVGSNWWRDYVHGKATVLLLNGRITFVGETQGYPKDCCLLLYGPKVRVGYQVWSWPLAAKRAKVAA